MGLIEDFIARYTKEYDFYDQAGRIATRLLETDLQEAGVRSIVTSRAKSIVRLQDKCRQREGKHGAYSSVDKIFDDIFDLAGVRVALYFPAEGGQAHKTITRLFHVISTKEEFPASDKTPPLDRSRSWQWGVTGGFLVRDVWDLRVRDFP